MKHRKPGSPEMLAALRIIERYRKAFADHGILSPIHTPSITEVADLIAGVEPEPKKPLPDIPGGVDDLIGN